MTDLIFEYRKQAGASPHRLVVLLYEQLIQDLHRAIAAIEENNIERRTNELGHALEVVGELQARLDAERGGVVSANLDRYYNVLRNCLLKAQFVRSQEILRGQIGHLVSLREAWLEVERAASAAANANPTKVVQEAAAGSATADWKA